MFMRFMFPLLLMIVLFAVFIYCLISVDNNAPKKNIDSAEDEQQKPAEHWKRACAFLIDLVIAGGLIYMMMQFYKLLNVDKSATFLYYFFNYLYIFIAIGYGFIQEAIYSSTIGKLLLGIRVENMNGDNISWQSAYTRNAFKFLNILGLLDYIVALLRNDHCRLGDLAARTRVV